MKTFIFAAAVLAAGTVPALAQTATADPHRGFYRESFLLTQASTGCPTAVQKNALDGYSDNWTFFYPGPGRPAAERGALLYPDSYTKITVINYPVTPAAGAVTWQGTLNGDPDQQGRPTVTFAANLTFVDNDSFLMTMTTTGATATGQCEITSNRAFVRQGIP